MSASTHHRVVVHGGELDGWLAERRQRGQDGRDEIWSGVHHVVPQSHPSHGMYADRLAFTLESQARRLGLTTLGEFNLGTGPQDYRVPDMAWTSQNPGTFGMFLATVEVVVEMESPGDETSDKIPFHLERGVRDVWVVNPQERTVRLLVGPDLDLPRSRVLDVELSEISAALGWA